MKRNITKTVYFIVFALLFSVDVNAQNIAIEQDGTCINCPNLTADPSAVLEIRATDRGVLIPRLADTSAIANPVVGLMIYDNSINDFQYFDGTLWKKVGTLDHVVFPSPNNTFIGVNVGLVTTGFGNIGIGNSALRVNTSGYWNTAIGVESLRFNTTGVQNTATGQGALNRNTTGINNSAFGSAALRLNTTGLANTAFGRSALSSNITGSFNTAIGHNAFASIIDLENATAIGFQAQPVNNNEIRLGNADVTQIGGYANWSNVSDARFKTQVQDNVPGLAFINLLNPVTYQMDMDAIAKFHHTPDSLRLMDSERAKAVIRYTGFLAQDVEKAAESVGYDFSGVDKPQHERDNYSLRYAEFVVPLVKAVQELTEEKDKEIADLKQKNRDLEARLSKIEAMLEN